MRSDTVTLPDGTIRVGTWPPENPTCLCGHRESAHFFCSGECAVDDCHCTNFMEKKDMAEHSTTVVPAVVLLCNSQAVVVPSGDIMDTVIDCNPANGFGFEDSDVGSAVMVIGTDGQFVCGIIQAVLEVAGTTRASIQPQPLTFQGTAILFRQL